MLDFPEVGGRQPEQRRAIHLRVATYAVVQFGPEGPIVKVVEGLVGGVFRIAEDGPRVPVVPLPREEVAALQQQHTLAGLGHAGRACRAPRTAADDQDVVVIISGGHTSPPLA
jgi:hypothetical protein